MCRIEAPFALFWTSPTPTRSGFDVSGDAARNLTSCIGVVSLGGRPVSAAPLRKHASRDIRFPSGASESGPCILRLAVTCREESAELRRLRWRVLRVPFTGFIRVTKAPQDVAGTSDSLRVVLLRR